MKTPELASTKFPWKLFSEQLPSGIKVGCDLAQNWPSAFVDPTVQQWLEDWEIDVIIFAFKLDCPEVRHLAGVAPFVPIQAADYGRNILTGVTAVVTGAIYYADLDQVAGRVVFHEIGHCLGCRHPNGQINADGTTSTRKPEPLFANANGIIILPANPGDLTMTDLMGDGRFASMSFYSNLAPGEGNTKANCAAAVAANWNYVAQASDVRKRLLFKSLESLTASERLDYVRSFYQSRLVIPVE